MALGAVVRADRRRQAALGPVGGGPGQRSRRDQDDGRSFTCGADRGIEAGRAAADDGNLGFEPIQHGKDDTIVGGPFRFGLLGKSLNRDRCRFRSFFPGDLRELTANVPLD